MGGVSEVGSLGLAGGWVGAAVGGYLEGAGREGGRVAHPAETGLVLFFDVCLAVSYWVLEKPWARPLSNENLINMRGVGGEDQERRVQ